MILALQLVEKSYGDQKVLDQMNLEVRDCNCLALVGPSGGGKSTTLRLIAGLETPDGGELVVNGSKLPESERELRKYRSEIGTVFQAYNLFPHLDALENITLPLLHVHKLSQVDALARAIELLEKFQLAEHRHKRPAELSGGQNQRVAIARALAANPELLLLDEPTSALDPEMAGEVLDAVEQLIAEGKQVIIVTHQIGFARHIADAMAIISQGKIIDAGPTQRVLEQPANRRTKVFLANAFRY